MKEFEKKWKKKKISTTVPHRRETTSEPEVILQVAVNFGEESQNICSPFGWFRRTTAGTTMPGDRVEQKRVIDAPAARWYGTSPDSNDMTQITDDICHGFRKAWTLDLMLSSNSSSPACHVGDDVDYSGDWWWCRQHATARRSFFFALSFLSSRGRESHVNSWNLELQLLLTFPNVVQCCNFLWTGLTVPNFYFRIRHFYCL
jgi:hypothetical protein